MACNRSSTRLGRQPTIILPTKLESSPNGRERSSPESELNLGRTGQRYVDRDLERFSADSGVVTPKRHNAGSAARRRALTLVAFRPSNGRDFVGGRRGSEHL